MIVKLHLCGPEGEALRQQLANALNTLKQDNRYVVNAMLNSGMEVPDTVIEAGLNYVPSRHEQSGGRPVQAFYGMKDMFESGEFSCGDGAAFEAAVMEEKYAIPTEVLCVATGDADYHGLFVTPNGVIDPTENWLRHWEGELGMPAGTAKQLPSPLKKPSGPQPELGASCRIVDGRVQCDVDGDAACCVDVERSVWRCSDPSLDGKPVQIAEVFQGKTTKQRWARTTEGVFVPVCAPSRAANSRNKSTTKGQRRWL